VSEPDRPDENEDGPTLSPSDEMAEALRQAEEAVADRRRGPGEDPPGAGDGQQSPDKMTIELLSQELQSLKDEFEARCKELEEANERHVRLQAEFDNFRRRTLKEKQESLQYGQQNLIKDLLSTVDNLERALGHVEQNSDADLQSILQGVELVHRELLGALGKQGVQVVDPAGQEFDPAYHEAMGQIPSDEVPPNGVIQVLQKGYLLKDRMLRPARVLVAAAAPDDQEKPEQG
jgi:molecular chaperone GrpE